jgi:uncharacterized circularly permuted ATP-grasp superfamily protein/uncharacterized alpha-E superfamily protein
MSQHDTTDQPVPPAADLFQAAAPASAAYREAWTATGAPRDHWQPLLQTFNGIGEEQLAQRQEKVGRMRHEDGATFNPFDDADAQEMAWALDMLPLPITARQWATLEAGVLQRARLLEMVLADVHGPQQLVHQGLLPPEMLFANPAFFHTCHGIQPTAYRFLPYYAVDLYRAADGSFRVFRDYGSSPAGLGYALENRIVISRVFASLYHETRVQRLAPFFHNLHQGFTMRAGLRREDPTIVILSPGPDHLLYFEHALLSRYLGYPLVESQDLTVRNGRVYLKKLADLEPVGSIFRHIPDEESDPFALRRETINGVAGLIQAAREGNIDLANPIGSGFIDTPALPLFLPGISRHLRGEELLLDHHPAWWCGSAEGYRQVKDRREELDLVPAFGRGERRAEQAAPLPGTPYAWLGRERLVPSTVPAWEAGRIVNRPVMLRLFACAVDGGFAVLPGGLAITAATADELLSGHPERQYSKDIWVLADRPVEPFSLMEGLESVTEFRRSSDLPSRVADHLLWLGRYLERAESLIRLLRALYRRLGSETQSRNLPELPFLFALLQARNPLAGKEMDPVLPSFADWDEQLHSTLYRREKPESVVALLQRVQDAARHVRDRLSMDSWQVLNRLGHFSDSSGGDALEHLDDTLFILSAFSGLAMESMTRGFGWRFLDMGRRMERAMNQTDLLQISLQQVCGAGRNGLEALLEVADSSMTYRARYRTTFQLAPVLDLLVVDESNPKSLAFQLNQLAGHIEQLPQQSGRRFSSPEERLALEMLTAVRLLNLSGLNCGVAIVEHLELPVFLEKMKTNLLDFAQHVTAHYLSRVPTTPHFSMILAEGEHELPDHP